MKHDDLGIVPIYTEYACKMLPFMGKESKKKSTVKSENTILNLR